ncbi:MAG: hypothetical protein JWN02_1037 [Acidobacteria bacterium]|nr:hypothetical protein [Acidobacteriota bacterium]
MSKSARFNIGFFVMDGSDEHLFLSVTEAFEHGPGIQRDGITSPRMQDPHSVEGVCNQLDIQCERPSTTIDPYLQRAGTWTIYHHLKRFVQAHPGRTIIAAQSNGDLTMNPWHIAYFGPSPDRPQRTDLCALLSGGSHEPINSRIYRCLIKWTGEAARACGKRYEFLDVVVQESGKNHALKLHDPAAASEHEQFFKKIGYNPRTRDVAPLVEFALSGKLIVERGIELSLANAIDRFQDVRHVFDLPEVAANGVYGDAQVSKINLGEYQLFANLNERRAALSSPVIINLDVDGRVRVRWDEVQKKLREEHFRETSDSPTRRGEFRRYLDDTAQDRVEIFFPHNVYPFGVLGLQPATPETPHGSIVCLSSGGLSGRVGNTLEGITRIMFDFFGCLDAIVLDEGFDVFSIVNPKREDGRCTYSNKELLKKVLAFTHALVEKEDAGSQKGSYAYPGGMKQWPLNRALMQELDDDYAKCGPADWSDVVLVPPQRSQVRSVLVFAVQEERGKDNSAREGRSGRALRRVPRR